MTSPALPIGWEMWRRHRWVLGPIFGYWLFLILLYTVWSPEAITGFLAQVLPAEIDPAEVAVGMAIASTIPAFLALGYLATVLCYGFDADVDAPLSGFPARMFALPVRTVELVGWPMLYGTVTVALLWVVMVQCILRPWGIGAPLWWPAALSAVLVAWLQALLWWPFGLPWLRGVIAVGVIPIPISIALFGIQVYHVSQPALTAIFAGLIPIGWGFAYLGIARARRGDVPQWLWLPQLAGGSALRWLHRRTTFAAAARAQVWFEWRRHGIALPVLVGCLLPFFLLSFFLEAGDRNPTARNLTFVLAVPLFAAGIAGNFVGKNNPWVKEHYAISTFAATRPLSTAALLAAKFKMAAWSTLAAWALLAITVPLTLVITGKHEELATWWRLGMQRYHALELAVMVLLTLLVLVLLTWKGLIGNMLIGLTGREWLIKGSIFGGLVLFFGLCLLACWIIVHPESHEPIWTSLPWLMGMAAGVKLLAGGLVMRALYRRGLVAARTLKELLAIWLAVAAGFFVPLCWLVPTEHVPVLLLAAVVVLCVPLVRPGAAPLVLAWNRHR